MKKFFVTAIMMFATLVYGSSYNGAVNSQIECQSTETVDTNEENKGFVEIHIDDFNDDNGRKKLVYDASSGDVYIIEADENISCCYTYCSDNNRPYRYVNGKLVEM